ncbi:hypothetical protein [Okeania sp. SIO2B3]|uniref:hypothetical protein n=1 Tax=Okeania sp. SIO2B3 TaxID=2607784 RepID=UPI0013C235C1|nr:hypothetical protein [Okeania sp. SIO2B3]NET42956.1 hypothetical protein [Okeania sp. SIO2B3]
MNSDSVNNIIQLAALASVVDGHASDQEKNLIVEMGSDLLNTPQEQIREILDRCIETFKNQELANNSEVALHSGLDALRSLDPSQKHLAFYICEKVIYQDGIHSGEIEFIHQLDELDRTAFS